MRPGRHKQAERAGARRPASPRLSRTLWGLAIVVVLAGIITARLDLADFGADPAAQTRAAGTVDARAFPLCEGARRVTCVVDGDTFWLGGEKIRIADIDTPEVSRPACRHEAELGARATARLAQLLEAGPFTLERSAARDTDSFGRSLRTVTREGRSLGTTLVAEDLAAPWAGAQNDWCAA